eukprot:CCRYP_004697-RB/>CCRYP_004697-RB protein AED:0.37 eAED:0.37 QI:377/1/1/1/1/1/4/17/1072
MTNRRKRPRPSTTDSSSPSAQDVITIDDGNEIDDAPPPSKSLVNNHFHSQLPAYLSEAFSDLYAQDGLVVMGRGLGWLGLLAAFCRFYGDNGDDDDDYNDNDTKTNHRQHDGTNNTHTKRPLIFVLNLRENERRILLDTLSSWGMPSHRLPVLITNEAGQSKDRSLLYARGGLFLITSRILIVDLLNGTANAREIEGMLVGHAEKVDEGSTEAFILRIFRGQKYFVHGGHNHNDDNNNSNAGFVKAFTDDAASLVRGFARVEKVMKSLQVPNLYLYPRFHASVAEELERHPPVVEELHVPLSEGMKRIQGAIAAAVRACMRDLRSRCPLVDFSELFRGDGWGDDAARDSANGGPGRKRRRGGENGGCGNNKSNWEIDIKKIVSTNFDMIVSKQLQGDWHRLGPDVKQRISDLTSLRKLFYQLIQSDCVSFWRTLEGIKARSVGHSSWILDTVGERLFELAKDRVYRIKRSDDKAVGTLERVLEENPKERLVHQVLTEIQNRWNAKVASSDSNDTRRSAYVLMMVKDGYTLRSVQSFLSLGKGLSMEERWRRYLKIVNEKTKSIIGSVNGGIDSLSEEQRLLFENDYPDKNIVDLNENLREQDRKRDLSDRKRRHDKITTERVRGMVDADAIRNRAQLDEVVEESKRDIMSYSHEAALRPWDDSDSESTSSSSSDDDDPELGYTVKPLEGFNLIIRAFDKLDDGEAELLLRDVMPSYVILYDSEPNFIRALEIYSNSVHALDNSTDRLQVFFLLYEAIAEESSFLQSLDREKKAFERLIDHKKRMPHALPTFNNFSTQEMQQTRGGVGGSYAGGTLPLSMDTRTGGGKQAAQKERRDIAVDVREFRSSLPSILHQGGMRLAPVTLTVGDFVLSNVHCVERKSISDLFGSFASGRLYSQAESMSKHYKCPCLLIEFDPEKTFELQSKHDLGGDIKMDSICSKLALLTMHFPKLRILWSRSPHETLKLFKKLKRNHQEVDVEKAVEIGNNDSLDDLLFGGADGYDEDEDNDDVNETAQRMLLRLPGVNPHNARKIMSECDSIAELAELSREELRAMVGPIAGQKLFTFFRQRFTA